MHKSCNERRHGTRPLLKFVYTHSDTMQRLTAVVFKEIPFAVVLLIGHKVRDAIFLSLKI